MIIDVPTIAPDISGENRQQIATALEADDYQELAVMQNAHARLCAQFLLSGDMGLADTFAGHYKAASDAIRELFDRRAQRVAS